MSISSLFYLPLTSGGARRRGRSFLLARIAQHADAGHLDLDDVAILHPERRRAVGADAAGGAGDDDVTGDELGEGRAIGDQGRDVEHEVRDWCCLYLNTVEAGRNGLLADVGDFIRRDHPWPERAGADEILAGRELRGVT